MTIVYVLLVAHFVADFLFQSDWMAIHKSKRWDALALHVGTYSIAVNCFVTSYWAVTDITPDAGAFLVWFTVNAVVHFVQDAITSRITARLWFFRPMFSGDMAVTVSYGDQWRDAFVQRGGSRHWFFVAIGADQLLHYVTLFVTAGWWLR